MKNIIFIIGLLLPFSYLLAQIETTNIQIVSNTTDWTCSEDMDGPYTDPVYDVGLCTADCVIDCMCGEDYAQPDITGHFPNCPDVQPIWGAPAPSDCIFPAAQYYFYRNFNIDEELDDCSRMKAVVTIQADQSYTLLINGEEVGSSNNWNWDDVFYHEVSGFLVSGDNEIVVRVNNTSGAECFNYAFLAFCLEINIETYNIGSADFTDVTSNSGNYVTVDGNPSNINQDVSHEWLVFWGDTPSDQPNFMSYSGVSTDEEYTFDGGEFEGCRYFRVIHRLSSNQFRDCQVCYSRLIPLCDDDALYRDIRSLLLASVASETDCDIFDQYDVGERNKLIITPSNTSSFKDGELKAISPIHLYPNPVEDIVRIEWKNFKPTEVLLSNGQGLLVDKIALSGNSSSTTIDVTTYPSGVYFVKLVNKDTKEQYTKRLVVSK